MHFLVVSDIHGADTEPICQKAGDFDGLIFLGDGADCLPRLRKAFPVCHAVAGNCDGRLFDLPLEKELRIEGKRLLLTHGHRYGVKWGLSVLADEAHARGCDAVLFGHTHTPTLTYDGGVGLFNPGAVTALRSTFGVLDVRKDGILFSVASFSGGVLL